MTEIERKALALVNEIERQEGLSDLTPRIMRGLVMDEALCRAIEQHEAFKREVSDAVRELIEDLRFHFDIPADVTALTKLRPFIIAKPDPLVEVVKACGYATLDAIEPEFAADLNSTAERLGYRLKLERIEHE